MSGLKIKRQSKGLNLDIHILLCFIHFSRADALRTYEHLFHLSVNFHPYALQIYLEFSFGDIVRVTDMATALSTSTTYRTFSCHRSPFLTIISNKHMVSTR